MGKELYRAIIKVEGGEDVVFEGNLVAAVHNGNFHMIGEVTEENLQNLIHASVYYITKAIHDKNDGTVLNAIDKCLSYTEYIMGILEDTLKQEEIQLPEISADVHEMLADFAVSVGEYRSSGTGYPIEENFEKFVKSVLFSSAIELVIKYNTKVELIYQIIDSAIEEFRKEVQVEGEESNYVLVNVDWKGKRQQTEGKIASIITEKGIAIVGNTFEYNLAELGIGTLASIGDMYLDRDIEPEKLELAMEDIYNRAMKVIRKRMNSEN